MVSPAFLFTCSGFVIFIITLLATSYSNLWNFCQSMSSLISLDSISFWMNYLTFIMILVIVYILVSLPNFYQSFLSLFVLFYSCLIVFSSSYLLPLYFFFELSLLPISYIIINWGTYSERSLSVEYMLVYTAFFSFPIVLAVLASFSSISNILIFCSLSDASSISYWISLLVIGSFIVNLPVYSLHYWLPQAHVEAPTFGSMVLASVLLNLGGYSLFRLYSIFVLDLVSSYIVCSFLVTSLFFSSIHTSFQSDFKRLIAYSSVVHISSLPILIMLSCSFSSSSLILVMLFHGLSSPLMFYSVGLSYAISGTRNLVILSSNLLYSSAFSSFLLCAFLFNLPAPPFISFLGELLVFLPIFYYFSFFSLFFIISAVFMSLIFNISWFIPNTFLINNNTSSLILNDLSIFNPGSILTLFYLTSTFLLLSLLFSSF